MTSPLPSTNHIKIARWSGSFLYIHTYCTRSVTCGVSGIDNNHKTEAGPVQRSAWHHGPWLQEAGGAAASSSVRSGEPVTGPCEEEAMIKKHNHRSVEPKRCCERGRRGEARRGGRGGARTGTHPFVVFCDLISVRHIKLRRSSTQGRTTRRRAACKTSPVLSCHVPVGAAKTCFG
jgi:hypothetical protein